MECSSLEEPAADESDPDVTELSSSSPAPTTQIEDAPSSRPSTTLVVRQACRRVLRKGKYMVGDDPIFLPLLLRATPEGTSRAITPDTRLVVEGFPRSGNTFAVFAFRNAQAQQVEVVGHVHHPSQVKLAVRKGLPTLLVIRRPLPCLASYLVTAPHGRPAGVLKEYVRYHRELLPYLDSVVVGEFEQVTHSFSDVITEINDRFGTTFAPFDQSQENVDRVFEDIEAHHAQMHAGKEVERIVPRPSSERANENRMHLSALQSPQYADLLQQAEQMYERCINRLP